MTRAETANLYFPEARSRLIDLAAFLDRVERSEGEEDHRLKSLRAALQVLAEPGPHKAREILLLLSDPTTDPIPAAGTKSATGAWPGFNS